MTEPITDAELAEWDQLCRDATWPEYLTVLRYSHGGGRVIQETGPSTSGGPNLIADFYDPGNREFYVASRTAMPRLLADLRQARADVARLTAAAEQARELLTDLLDETGLKASYMLADGGLHPGATSTVAAVWRFLWPEADTAAKEQP